MEIINVVAITISPIIAVMITRNLINDKILKQEITQLQDSKGVTV